MLAFILTFLCLLAASQSISQLDCVCEASLVQLPDGVRLACGEIMKFVSPVYNLCSDRLVDAWLRSTPSPALPLLGKGMRLLISSLAFRVMTSKPASVPLRYDLFD